MKKQKISIGDLIQVWLGLQQVANQSTTIQEAIDNIEKAILVFSKSITPPE